MAESLKEQIRELAENEAMLTILSDIGDLTTDEIVEAWQNDKMPDEILVWEPFEYLDPKYLLERWHEFAGQFERLIIQGRELNG